MKKLILDERDYNGKCFLVEEDSIYEPLSIIKIKNITQQTSEHTFVRIDRIDETGVYREDIVRLLKISRLKEITIKEYEETKKLLLKINSSVDNFKEVFNKLKNG